MTAVVGTLLLSAALFVFAWARVEHRRARPSRWLRLEIGSQLVVFLILVLSVSGGGLILHATGTQTSAPLAVLDGVLIVAIIAGTLLLLVAYGRHGRRVLGEGASAAAMAPAAMRQSAAARPEGSDPRPPVGRTPRGGGRRAA